jgi:hypothetical protein
MRPASIALALAAALAAASCGGGGAKPGDAGTRADAAGTDLGGTPLGCGAGLELPGALPRPPAGGLLCDHIPPGMRP